MKFLSDCDMAPLFSHEICDVVINLVTYFYIYLCIVNIIRVAQNEFGEYTSF